MKQLIEITTNVGCRNNCVYCPQKTIVSSYKKISDNMMMSFDVFCKCLNSLPGDMMIVFCGMSEPWLNKKTTDMVLHAYNLGFPVAVNTTLAGMTKNDVLLLENVDFDYFSIHLPNENEKFMVKSDYVDLLDFVCSHIKDLDLTYFFSLDKDLEKIIFNYGYTPVCRKFVSRAGSLYVPKHRSGKGFCVSNQMNVHIVFPNGDVFLCCMDYGLQVKLGNLLYDSYDDLHQSKTWFDIKKSQKLSDSDIICRSCEYFIPYFSFQFFEYVAKKYLVKKRL